MKKQNLVKVITQAILAVIAAAFVALVILRKSLFPADSFFYTVYEAEYAGDVFVRLFKTLTIVLGGFVLVELGVLISWLATKFKNNTVKTFALLIGNVLKYVAIIAILFVTLAAWGVDTTALVTGAGVLTLVIGLGCQTLISDIVAGIFILFEGDIKVGDVVVINGWRGTVIQIGLRRTKIEDMTGNINVVNNSSISNIINNTRDLSLSVCDVGIEYDESIEKVEKVLKDNFPEIKNKIPAIVEGPYYKGIQELGDSAVVVRVIAKVKEEDKYQVQRDLNREIKMVFDANNINIPFTQVTLSYREKNEAESLPTSEKKNIKKFVDEQKELSKNLEQEQ